MALASASHPIPEPPSSPPALLECKCLSRKRSRPFDYDDITTSSDPPMFSSDPPDPSVENYAQTSRKKQYRGAWWHKDPRQRRLNAQKTDNARRGFTRNLDSGIFMNSDASEDSLSSGLGEETAFPAAHWNGDKGFHESYPSQPDSSAQSTVVKSQIIAASRVEDCLRYELEEVDLSDLQLGELSDHLLSPLRSLTKPARFLDRDMSPEEEEFEPLRPSLQLYLAHNRLTWLPKEMWALDNLTVLSIRNNNLRHLPSSIACLKNLVELNLAGNELKWLPWEMLGMLAPAGSLKTLHLLPNPFVRPFAERLENPLLDPHKAANARFLHQELAKVSGAGQSTTENQNGTAQANMLQRLLATYFGYIAKGLQEAVALPSSQQPQNFSLLRAFHVASTPVNYFSMDGSRMPVSPHNTTADIDGVVSPVGLDVTQVQFTPPLNSVTKVSSLLELALSSCSAATSIANLREYLPTDTPSRVHQALNVAEDVCREEGLRRCSICQRCYIIPRTEWIEYWHRVPVNWATPEQLTALASEEVFLPMLRRGCSWSCTT